MPLTILPSLALLFFFFFCTLASASPLLLTDVSRTTTNSTPPPLALVPRANPTFVPTGPRDQFVHVFESAYCGADDGTGPVAPASLPLYNQNVPLAPDGTRVAQSFFLGRALRPNEHLDLSIIGMDRGWSSIEPCGRFLWTVDAATPPFACIKIADIAHRYPEANRHGVTKSFSCYRVWVD